MTISIAQFGGMRPARAPTTLPDNLASRAVNTRLLDGVLRALCAPKDVLACPEGVRATFVGPVVDKDCGDPRCFTDCVGVYVDNVTGCNGFDSLVVFSHTGGDHARIDLCSGETHPLCLNPPTVALTAGIVTMDPAAELDARVYTYTYVDIFGQETAPAPPSNQVTLDDQGTVGLTGFTPPPAGAQCIRIYRTPSSFEDGFNPGAAFSTSFHLVEEVPVAGFLGTYTDDKRIKDMCLGTLRTLDNCCPPEFCGTAQADCYYVGFNGNRLWVSAPMRADNFPLANTVELKDRIVSVVATYRTLYVATTGHPYRITIRAGEGRDEIDVQRYEEPYPIANAGTLVSTPFGALYSARQGIVALSERAAPALLTSSRVSRKQWKEFHPRFAAFYDGRYYGFRPNSLGIVFDVIMGSDRTLELGEFYLHTVRAEEAHVSPDGYLYVRSGDVLQQWEEGDDLLPYEWVSKHYLVEEWTTHAALRVIADFGPPVEVEVYVDNQLAFSGEVCTKKAIYLPRMPRGCKWFVKLKGTTPIHAVVLGHSTQEI